ncbi:hypothetical protein B0H19DRAFT_964984 [Mycena capillaripes]|nr:hypothetical protein B0H19DRAFT_964984 [Mycena capillaripes]
MCLPPYSPDYNPMEPGFSKMKATIRRDGQQFRAATEHYVLMWFFPDDDKVVTLTQLHNAVYSITPEDAAGWFRHSGYF